MIGEPRVSRRKNGRHVMDFEGAAGEVAGEPQHGDSGTCAMCGGEIEFYRDSVWVVGSGEETLTTWWAHAVHPADGHDAVLGGPA